MPRFALLLCVCVLAAGCGGASPRKAAPPPKLPRALAQRLAAESDAVAAAVAGGDACRAQQLAAQLRTDIDGSLARIPARFHEPLSSGVNEVAAALPRCVPPAPVQASPPFRFGHGFGHGHGRGHGHDHGPGPGERG